MFLDFTAWLTWSSVAKLPADLNHDLGTKTLLVSLRNAGEGQRLNDAKSPTRQAQIFLE